MPPKEPNPPPRSAPTPFRASGWRRFAGYAVMAMAWGVALALGAFFTAIYAIYADVKAPATSRLTAGTGLEPIAQWLYETQFRPIWQTELDCARYDPELTYVPKPGRVRYRSSEFDTFITMTPAQAREQPPPAGPGRPRVVVLGDSFAMGWGVNDAETFSAVLQSRHGFATTNLAVSSYGTARELLWLRRQKLAAEADAIVIQFCQNDDPENVAFLADALDFVSPGRTAETWRQIHTHHPRPITYGAVLASTTGLLRERLRREGVREVARSLVRGRLMPFGSQHPIRGPRASAGAAEAFLAVWDRFPELAQKRLLVTEQNPNAFASGVLDELEKRVADRPNIKIVRLRFAPEHFFRFDGHLNAAGHAAAAAQIDRALREHEATVRGAAGASRL